MNKYNGHTLIKRSPNILKTLIIKMLFTEEILNNIMDEEEMGEDEEETEDEETDEEM